MVSFRRLQFPGQQKIIVSKKWGFTPLRREEYLGLKAEGKLQQCVRALTPCVALLCLADLPLRALVPLRRDGAYVQFLKPQGDLVRNLKALDKVAASN